MPTEFEIVLAECRRRWQPEDSRLTARRLFHGRGRAFPGFEDLTVDRFGPVLLVACFSDRIERAEALALRLAEALAPVGGVAVQHRRGRQTHTRTLLGEVPETVEVLENGLKFQIRPLANQNVGLFLDMAPARAWVRAHAEGWRILNLFAYTCAFSVAALAGGAKKVVNVDMSRAALSWGAVNHALNEQNADQAVMLGHNLFKSWGRIRALGPYDLVIIDPPSRQPGSFSAERQYGQILKRLEGLTEPGSEVLACLNSPFLNADFLPGQMSRWCPQAGLVCHLPASEDFPDAYPDRALKVARFRIH